MEKPIVIDDKVGVLAKLREDAIHMYETSLENESLQRQEEKERYIEKMESCPVKSVEYRGMERRRFDSLSSSPLSLGSVCMENCNSPSCRHIDIGSIRNFAANVAMASARR